jgi:hypothetical protein
MSRSIQKQRVSSVGTPIPQTLFDFLTLNTRYEHNFSYSIARKTRHCKIITETPNLDATISHNSIVNEPEHFGATVTNTNFIPILINDNNEIIHTFDDAIAPYKKGGYSKFVLTKTNNSRYSELFYALIPNSKTEIECW